MSQAIVEERYRIISENIRKYRLKKGLKQEEVAGGLCSISQFSKIENGKSPLKPDVLRGIASRLGVSVEQLQTVDDGQQELREQLEMSRSALMAQQIDLSVQYARTVATLSRARGYQALYEEAIMQECQSLTQGFRFVEVIERLEQVLLIEQVALTPLNRTLFLLELGRAHVKTGNRDQSYTYFLQAEASYQSLEDIDPSSIEAMRIPHMLSKGCTEMRNHHAALRYAREARRLAELNDRPVNVLNSQLLEASSLALLGEREQAQQLFLQALERAQNLSQLLFVAALQNNIGCVYLMNQELGAAQQYFERAMRNFELLKSWEGTCECLLNLAEVALLQGEFNSLLLYTERATVVLDSVKPQGYMYRARMYKLLSQMHLSNGHTEWGVRELERALYIYDSHCVFLEAYEVAVQLGDLFYEQQDARAVDLYRKAIDYDRRMGPLR